MEEKEKVIEIDIERLKDFPNHPFRVDDDRQMRQLKESIQSYGILTPLIVRPTPSGSYQIISGHRRKYAALSLGYTKLPVIIRILKDDAAIIAMIDANLNREDLLPSERAKAYKMKYDAIKRIGKKKTSGQFDHLKGIRSVEILGEDMGESPKQIQRYLKLANLIPEFLQMLDDGKIGFTPAVTIAFLKQEEQKQLISAMNQTQAKPSVSQAQYFKELSKEGKLTERVMVTTLSEVKKGEIHRVMFKNEQLYKYFPANSSPLEMKEAILQMLDAWSQLKGKKVHENV